MNRFVYILENGDLSFARDKLAVPHQTESTFEANLYAHILQVMGLIAINNIDSMGELLRFRDKLRGVNVLIGKDLIRKRERAYYLFFPGEIFYCRVTTTKRVDDKIDALIERLTRELDIRFTRSKKAGFEVRGKRYYYQYYSIPKSQDKLFGTFLEIFYPQADRLEQKNAETMEKTTSHNNPIFNRLFMLTIIPLLQMFYLPLHLHVIKNKKFYLLLNYLMAGLSIIILVPVFSICDTPVLYGILPAVGLVFSVLFILLGAGSYLYKYVTVENLKRFDKDFALKKLNQHLALITLELIKTPTMIMDSGTPVVHPARKILEEYQEIVGRAIREAEMRPSPLQRAVLTINNLGHVDNLALLDGNPEKIKMTLERALSRIRILYGPGIFGSGQKILAEDVVECQDDEIALLDILVYRFSKNMLGILEDDPAVAEVTAYYQRVKNFSMLSCQDKKALITYWARKGNMDYAELLQFVNDNLLTENQLIALISIYVLGVHRGRNLRTDFQGVVNDTVHSVESVFRQAIGTYEELVKSSHEYARIVERVKGAESNIEVLTKFRMIVNLLPVIESNLVDMLRRNQKFIRLNMDELLKTENRHIMVWLERLLRNCGTEYPIILFSRSNTVTKDMLLKGYGGLSADKFLTDEDVRLMGIKETDIAILYDLRDVPPNKDEQRNGFSIPFLYSVTGIYLSAEILIAGGKVENIKDSLIKKYTARVLQAAF